MRRVCAVVEASGVEGRNPILEPLGRRLAEHEVELVTWDPTLSTELPPQAPDADLYLLKADDPAALSAAGCLADEGAPFLNSYWATEAAHDKARTQSRLVRAGLPMPATRLVSAAAQLAAELEAGPRFVKPVRGAHGDEAGPLGRGEAESAGPGPWLVQEVIGDGSSAVLKVYGVRSQTAVRRMVFVPGVVDAPRECVDDADQSLARMAVTAAEVCRLVCYGVDFVIGRDGPVIVDVNAFPGYRDVPDAAEWLAAAVISELRAPP